MMNNIEREKIIEAMREMHDLTQSVLTFTRIALSISITISICVIMYIAGIKIGFISAFVIWAAISLTLYVGMRLLTLVGKMILSEIFIQHEISLCDSEMSAEIAKITLSEGEDINDYKE